MSIETTDLPSVETFAAATDFEGIPELVNITYDLWVLRVTLQFEDLDRPVYVDFEGVEGFRVLDEGNLDEFWEEESRADSWLWSVSEGGWFDQESARAGFVAGADGEFDEYLIVTDNECVSVLAYESPVISTPTF